MLWELNTGSLSEQLTTALTLIATVINVSLWFTTRRTVKLHRQEVNHQIANSHSLAQHQIVDAHRDIFLGILNNPTLLKIFTQANGLDSKTWVLQKLSAFLINQVMVEYLNFQHQTVSPSRFEGFKRDAQDVFAYPLVRSHWQHVKILHSKEFCHFVETELLPIKPPQTEVSMADTTEGKSTAQD